jgi:hypothetical protein
MDATSPQKAIVMAQHTLLSSAINAALDPVLRRLSANCTFKNCHGHRNEPSQFNAAAHLLLRLRLPPLHPRPRMRLLPQRTPLHQQPGRFLRPASQLPAFQHGELLSAIELFFLFETSRLVIVISALPLELIFLFETLRLVVVVFPASPPLVLHQRVQPKRLQLLPPSRSQVPFEIRLSGSCLSSPEVFV